MEGSSSQLAYGEHRMNSFCWQNISVWKRRIEAQGLWRRTTYTDFQIIENASGFVPRGSLLAIIGPSGSGKTTLLAAISRRLTEKVCGNMYVNGKCVTTDQMLRLSAFVPQDHSMLPSLTVHEYFRFMATLKMDRNVSEKDRVKKIATLMKTAGIEELRSSYVSDLSEGEKRRLSITVHMVSDPFLLFCDEPTTGLDSVYAFVIVKMLKKFSSQGKIVVCNIHQPAASIYELFDRVLLLASKGRTAYFGAVTLAENYFQNLGFSCPPNNNIAEFLINLVSLDDFDAEKRVDAFCQQYSKSSAKCILINDQINDCLNKEDKMDPLPHKYFLQKKPTLRTQIFALMKRSFLNFRRGNSDLFTFTASLVFFFTISVTLCSQITLCSSNSIKDVQGFLIPRVFAVFVLHFAGVVMEEKLFMMREVNNGYYTIEAYCISELLKKVAFAEFESFLIILMCKSFIPIFDHLSFWDLFWPIMTETVAATAFGCMLASAFEDGSTMLVVCNTSHVLTDLLCGQYIILRTLPIVFWYLRYLSICFYTVEYVVVLTWKKAQELHVHCENSSTGLNEPEAVLTKLSETGYDVQNYQKDNWILIFVSVILFAISYILLRKRSKQSVAY